MKKNIEKVFKNLTKKRLSRYGFILIGILIIGMLVAATFNHALEGRDIENEIDHNEIQVGVAPNEDVLESSLDVEVLENVDILQISEGNQENVDIDIQSSSGVEEEDESGSENEENSSHLNQGGDDSPIPTIIPALAPEPTSTPVPTIIPTLAPEPTSTPITSMIWVQVQYYTPNQYPAQYTHVTITDFETGALIDSGDTDRDGKWRSRVDANVEIVVTATEYGISKQLNTGPYGTLHQVSIGIQSN